MLGPLLRAGVGDTLEVHFKNALNFTCSIHPSGLAYSKANEGAGVPGVAPQFDGVAPGASFTYVWSVPARAGPGPGDPSTIAWPYFSHVDQTRDINAGLVGAVIVSRAGAVLDAERRPTDCDREFVLYLSVVNELASPFIAANMASALVPASLLADPDFQESNLKHTINGRGFNNVPGLEVSVGQRVRWHLLSLGTEVDLHSVHFHALTAQAGRVRSDVFELLPGTMTTVDSDIDVAGEWYVHCHVNDHVAGGMIASYNATGPSAAPPVTGRTRQYFVAADPVDWDYLPVPPPGGISDIWFSNAGRTDRIGSVYAKALYVEYTDATFTTQAPVPASQAHKGILGPVLRAQVGDKLQVTFRNHVNGSEFSMHPHGVFYDKASEGAGMPGLDNPAFVGVRTGEEIVYEWVVPPRAGPAAEGPSSVVWLYHSHVDEAADTNAGLVGAIVVTRAGTPVDAEGKPDDVDKEFVLFLSVLDESASVLISTNIAQGTLGQDAAALLADPAFLEAQLKHTINGYAFDNVPGLNMATGDRVRWYLMALGNEVDLHALHFHAAAAENVRGHRTDVFELLPASMTVVDTLIDVPGAWSLHCHVNDHREAGMTAKYVVTGNASFVDFSGLTRRYFIAAEQAVWDYMPTAPLDPTIASVWYEPGVDRIGKAYIKALYVEYTDATFTVRKPVPPHDAHKGLLGPLIRAQVGDRVVVTFRNSLPFPASMHPHGLLYTQDQEGVVGVAPNATFVYEWHVPARAGPSPLDPSTVAWLYHSAVDETRDTNAGLVGAIIVSHAGAATTNEGLPLDVEHEAVLFLTVLDETKSHFIGDNIASIGGDPVALLQDEGFLESSLKHVVNGFAFDNVRGLSFSVDDRVRWHLMALGSELDLHTVSLHSTTTLSGGQRTNSVELLPASMRSLDTVMDTAGHFLVHCQVNDHVDAGMLASFTTSAAAAEEAFFEDCALDECVARVSAYIVLPVAALLVASAFCSTRRLNKKFVAGLQRLAAGLVFGAMAMVVAPLIVEAELDHLLYVILGFLAGLVFCQVLKAVFPEEPKPTKQPPRSLTHRATVIFGDGARAKALTNANDLSGNPSADQTSPAPPPIAFNPMVVVELEASTDGAVAVGLRPFPLSFLVAIIVSAAVDGFLIGIATFAAKDGDFVVIIALALKNWVVGMALATALAYLPPHLRIRPILLPAFALCAAAVLVTIVAQATQGDALFDFMIAFGAASLLHVITDELLLEAANTMRMEASPWFVDVQFFVGYLLAFVITRVEFIIER